MYRLGTFYQSVCSLLEDCEDTRNAMVNLADNMVKDTHSGRRHRYPHEQRTSSIMSLSSLTLSTTCEQPVYTAWTFSICRDLEASPRPAASFTPQRLTRSRASCANSRAEHQCSKSASQRHPATPRWPRTSVRTTKKSSVSRHGSRNMINVITYTSCTVQRSATHA